MLFLRAQIQPTSPFLKGNLLRHAETIVPDFRLEPLGVRCAVFFLAVRNAVSKVVMMLIPISITFFFSRVWEMTKNRSYIGPCSSFCMGVNCTQPILFCTCRG